MDKRSFIAVIVTFAILIGWQYLYMAPRQKEAARKRAAELRMRQAEDSLAALEAARQPSSEDGGAASGEVDRGRGEEYAETGAEEGDVTPGEADEAEPVEIAIDNGVMTAVLSSRGAELTGVELSGYERSGGGAVQLVPEGEVGAAALALLDDGRWRPLSARVFEVTIDGREVEGDELIRLGEEREEVRVVLSETMSGGGRASKAFTFRRDSYEVGLDVVIRREGEIRDAEAYSVSWKCGLEFNEKDRNWEKRQMAALGKVGEDFHDESASKLDPDERKEHSGVVVWAGVRSKYFLSAIITGDQRSGTLAMSGDKERGVAGYAVEYPFRGDPRRIEDSFRLYLGPLDMDRLEEYGVGLEKAIDLGRLRFFSSFILKLMVWMYGFIPNYGAVIIIISIMTKILFYRLTHKSFKSMKDMQRLQPRIKELQEKYKDDKAKLNEATMKMYKEAGVNPLGGCLPLLLQMPVFIALFNVLRNTIELRNAQFVLWIDDLSSPDVLFGLGVNLPFLGSEFHLLPILMGGAMVLQSKLGGSPTGDSAGPAAQTKMMQTFMPIIFTVLFYNMPSGLVLYWLVNNILSIAQQYYVHRQIEADEAAAAAGA